MKAGLILVLFCFTRAALPRYRWDQLMSLAWRTFLPIVLTGCLFIYSITLFISNIKNPPLKIFGGNLQLIIFYCQEHFGDFIVYYYIPIGSKIVMFTIILVMVSFVFETLQHIQWAIGEYLRINFNTIVKYLCYFSGFFILFLFIIEL